MNSYELWQAVSRPPKSALKTINAGRLKGKSDIRPQWRYEIMTQTYGLCGIGWKYEVIDEQVVEGSDGQKMAKVNINLFVRVDDEWSDPIPGTGGSMFVENERNGAYTNDECFKMATTDALSVAMSRIGVASDIYMGLWDGSKYIKYVGEPNKPKPTPTETPKPQPEEPTKYLQSGSKDHKALEAKIGKELFSRDTFKEYLYSINWIAEKDGEPSLLTLTEERARKMLIPTNWEKTVKKVNEFIKEQQQE